MGLICVIRCFVGDHVGKTHSHIIGLLHRSIGGKTSGEEDPIREGQMILVMGQHGICWDMSRILILSWVKVDSSWGSIEILGVVMRSFFCIQ